MMLALLVALLLVQNPVTHLPKPHSKEAMETQATLGTQVLNYSVTGSNFVETLINVAGRFKFPLGIEWVREPANTKPVHFTWKKATVQKVMWDIVHTQPSYEIEVRNAVVHVQPSGLVPSQQNFLKLKILQFDVRDQVVEVASKHLSELVRQRVASLKGISTPSVRGGIGFSQGAEVGDNGISLVLTDISVENALDALILNSRFKVWLVTFAADGKLTLDGFRRTTSAASGNAIPDEYQPFWELLQWGKMPY